MTPLCDRGVVVPVERDGTIDGASRRLRHCPVFVTPFRDAHTGGLHGRSYPRSAPDGQPKRLVLRLAVHRKTPEQAWRPQDDPARAARRRGRTPDLRSLDNARHVLLLISLPQGACSTGDTARLYRLRWRVEPAFKRRKSLAGLDALPTRSLNLARA